MPHLNTRQARTATTARRQATAACAKTSHGVETPHAQRAGWLTSTRPRNHGGSPTTHTRVTDRHLLLKASATNTAGRRRTNTLMRPERSSNGCSTLTAWQRSSTPRQPPSDTVLPDPLTHKQTPNRQLGHTEAPSTSHTAQPVPVSLLLRLHCRPTQLRQTAAAAAGPARSCSNGCARDVVCQLPPHTQPPAAAGPARSCCNGCVCDVRCAPPAHAAMAARAMLCASLSSYMDSESGATLSRSRL